jgi:hypothetical protein
MSMLAAPAARGVLGLRLLASGATFAPRTALQYIVAACGDGGLWNAAARHLERCAMLDFAHFHFVNAFSDVVVLHMNVLFAACRIRTEVPSTFCIAAFSRWFLLVQTVFG